MAYVDVVRWKQGQSGIWLGYANALLAKGIASRRPIFFNIKTIVNEQQKVDHPLKGLLDFVRVPVAIESNSCHQGQVEYPVLQYSSIPIRLEADWQNI